MNEIKRRKRMRLKGYDYSTEGMYFVTFCVQNWHKLLGEIPVEAHIVRPYDVEINLSEIGKILETSINNIPQKHPSILVDKYVIMPNHVHLILMIAEDWDLMYSPTISLVIKQCKEYVTKQIGYKIWQKSFYDHIIRNDKEYLKIWHYIDNNPIRWTQDRYYQP